MNIRVFWILAILTTSVSGCASEDGPSIEAQRIADLYDGWVIAANHKNLESWSRFVAPNAVFMPPGHPPLVAHEDILSFYDELFRNPQFLRLDCSQEFVEIAKAKDMAWTHGVCNAVFRSGDGELSSRPSKWTKVWVRLEDGSWKCRLNAWNYNDDGS